MTKVKNTLIAGLHCALGEYEVALRLLHKQIALIDPKPIKVGMKYGAIYRKPRLALLSNAPSMNIQLVDNQKRPIVPINLHLIKSVYNVNHFTTIERT